MNRIRITENLPMGGAGGEVSQLLVILFQFCQDTHIHFFYRRTLTLWQIMPVLVGCFRLNCLQTVKCSTMHELGKQPCK